MHWSEAHVAGFLLAATLANDRAAREAVPGLTYATRGQLQAAGESLAGLDSAQRRRIVTALVANVRPATEPRRNFAPERGLGELLRRTAASRGGR